MSDFTVSPRVRKIAAHDPHTLAFWDYYRQIFWSSAVDLSDKELEKLIAEFTLDARVLGPGEQASTFWCKCWKAGSSSSIRCRTSGTT